MCTVLLVRKDVGRRKARVLDSLAGEIYQAVLLPPSSPGSVYPLCSRNKPCTNSERKGHRSSKLDTGMPAPGP